MLRTHIPAWEGREFEAPKFSDLRRWVKANVFVPGVSKSNSLILSRLGRQNPGLKVDDWRVYHREEKDNGVFLILGVDKDSLDVLKGLGLAPHFELSRVRFSLPDPARSGGGAEGTS